MILNINWQEFINRPIVMISPLILLALLFIIIAVVKGRKKD